MCVFIRKSGGDTRCFGLKCDIHQVECEHDARLIREKRLRMGSKWVYNFDDLDGLKSSLNADWDSVRGLLGGKGANLADMASIGVPVPPGFTITTEACNQYLDDESTLPAGLWDQTLEAMASVEQQTGKLFGSGDVPLLVAVRSGAKFSMPGMMDTVLNVGMNDEVAASLIALTGDERFVLDSYRRFVQMFSTVVSGLPTEPFERILAEHRKSEGVASDSDLSAPALRSVLDSFTSYVVGATGSPLPTDPYDQLTRAIRAVFDSWNSKRAFDYRKAADIDHDLGTAVNIVAMVFGNTGTSSATGVAMSRDSTTGEKRLEGDFLVNAQGEDVVAGNRPTEPISRLADIMPEPATQLFTIAKKLESHYRDMQDMEFTIEDGRLWLLQTRTGKRTAQAAVRIAVDMVDEGVISKQEAVKRVSADQVDFFLHPQFSPDALVELPRATSGLNVSPGAAVGVIAFDPDLAERWANDGRSVILVRHETKPDDVHGMLAANGILTSSGGRTSHAALVARQFGKPAVTGAVDIEIDMGSRKLRVSGVEVDEGDWVSIDGTTGDVYLGQVPTVEPDFDNHWLEIILGWADEFRQLEVRANADDEAEASRARAYGATGVGLCRTEHMFFAPDRLPLVQRMITAPSVSEQREAIAALLPYQKQDFAGLFRAMSGMPVIIRLLDPPLHEFLPSKVELIRQSMDYKVRLNTATSLDELEKIIADLNEVNELLSRVEALEESNPMLGLRGVRLGIKIPDLPRMQTRAIMEAAIEVAAEGGDPRPEIMIPLVSHANELARQRSIVAEVADEVLSEHGADLPYQIGTMIEVPRAALTARQIAEHADFFSFGTNDLTQTTYGISRDDAEQSFIRSYVHDGVLSANPFASVDESGVGRLIEMAVDEASHANSHFETGVCGEHGGDPRSIHVFHRLGLDYVSCSAYRVPVARLAAAQAALASSE